MKWKLGNRGIVESSGLKSTSNDNHGSFWVFNILEEMNCVKSFAPRQYHGKESDFTILFKDGTTQVAKLILPTIYDWWEINAPENFTFIMDVGYYNINYKNDFAARINHKWPTSRQISALKALIEIYKD